MKKLIFILFIISGLSLNAQNFSVKKFKSSDNLQLTPTFDTLKLDNRKRKLVYFDSNYINDFTNKIISESLTQPQKEKLSVSSLAMIIYIGNDGKVFYASFMMRKDLKDEIRDSDFRTIYDKVKNFTFEMDKAREDPRYPGDFTSFMIKLRP